MLSMIIAFTFCCICSAKPMECDERMKRNTIIYLGKLIFGTVGLPIVSLALMKISNSKSTFDFVDPNKYLLTRGIVVVQVILYLIELFYRISIRIEVILHHAITAIMIIYFLLVTIKSFALHYAMKLAFVLSLMA